MLEGAAGIITPPVAEGDVHTYWKYCLRVDPDVVEGGSPGFGKALKDLGIASAPRYIQKPAFVCEIFQKQRTFGNSRFPFTLARPEAVDYDRGQVPGHVLRASSGSWCFPGTRTTPTSTFVTSAPRSRMR